MTRKCNIALVSDLLPDKNFTGGQVLERIISNTQNASVEIYWLNQSRLPRPDRLPNNASIVRRFTFEQSPPRRRRGLSKSHKAAFSNPFYLGARLARTLLQAFGLYRIRWIQKIRGARDDSILKLLARSLQSIAMGFRLARQLNAKEYDLVWLVLQGEKLAIVFYILSVLLNKKFILQQWDPIGWWLKNNHYGPTLIGHMEGMVYAIERRAYATMVPSLTWQEAQLKRGLNSVRIDNFFKEDELTERPFIKLANPEKLHAVFIGQTYAFPELAILLTQTAKQAAFMGRKLILHYFGNGRLVIQLPNLEIIRHDYLARNELIERIRKFDVALLPYPMQSKFRQASRYSFPSKSRIYLAAGLPVLAQAELDSSPHLFYKNRYAPYYLNLRDAGDLSGFLKNSVTTAQNDIRDRTHLAASIVKEYFSEHAELDKFHTLLKEVIHE